MSRSKLCPNCGREHGPLDACMLGVLAGIERDRNGAGFTPAELGLVDASRFWDEVGGPAVDWLESHVTAQKIETGWTDADDEATAEASSEVDAPGAWVADDEGQDTQRLPYEVRDTDGDRRADFLVRHDAERYARERNRAAGIGEPGDAAAEVDESLRSRMDTLDVLARCMDAANDGAEPDELGDYELTREQIEAVGLDPDAFDAENVDVALTELPLAVEATMTFEVVFGTGGPDDRLLIECDGVEPGPHDGHGGSWEPRRVSYRYSWTGSAERELHGRERELALDYARRVVPELGE